MLEKVQQNWLELLLLSAVGVGVGYAIGARVGTRRGTSRERDACDVRERTQYRRGLGEARRAVDSVLTELSIAAK
jgi:hypothetical protein